MEAFDVDAVVAAITVASEKPERLADVVRIDAFLDWVYKASKECESIQSILSQLKGPINVLLAITETPKEFEHVRFDDENELSENAMNEDINGHGHEHDEDVEEEGRIGIRGIIRITGRRRTRIRLIEIHIAPRGGTSGKIGERHSCNDDAVSFLGWTIN